jgi:hypothetical protein
MRAMSAVENVGIEGGGAALEAFCAFALTPPLSRRAISAACTAFRTFAFMISCSSYFTPKVCIPALRIDLRLDVVQRGVVNCQAMHSREARRTRLETCFNGSTESMRKMENR